MATSENYEEAHKDHDVDLTFASRGLWLVKVPKYLADVWKNSPTTTVGKLKTVPSTTRYALHTNI